MKWSDIGSDNGDQRAALKSLSPLKTQLILDILPFLQSYFPQRRLAPPILCSGCTPDYSRGVAEAETITSLDPRHVPDCSLRRSTLSPVPDQILKALLRDDRETARISCW